MPVSKYTPEQLDEYLRHINFPFLTNRELQAFAPTEDNLCKIFFLHKLAFPFENTGFHYEKHLSGINAEDIFKRAISEARGLGSHCCGLNTLLLHVLSGLGYRAHAGLGRFNRAPNTSLDVNLGPRTHMIIFVQTICSPQVYLVDAGGGTVGIVKPIPIRDGAIIQGASAPEEHRLVRIPSFRSVACEMSLNCTASDEWQLEMRCGAHMSKWRALFRFSTQPVDSTAIEAANRLVLGPQGDATFRKDIFCVKYFRSCQSESEGQRSGRNEAVGNLGRLVLSGDKVTRRIGDGCETISIVKTESEKKAALKEIFGMKINCNRSLDGRLLRPL